MEFETITTKRTSSNKRFPQRVHTIIRPIFTKEERSDIITFLAPAFTFEYYDKQTNGEKQ